MTQSMGGQRDRSRGRRCRMAFLVLCLAVSAFAQGASIQVKKQKARTQFESAERMREELNGLPQKERTRREYQRVTDAYRRVYYTAPMSSKADASVIAAAELLAECGRAFNDEKLLRNAISQYEFLRREYPGSKYRFDALFTIGQIYKDDLQETDKAREAFQEVIRRYPHMQVSADAREALAEIDAQARARLRPHERAPEAEAAAQSKPAEAHVEKVGETTAESQHPFQLVTGIRHWSTPDYTRVAIDLEQEVKYEAGRVPNPDRIFFDLHDSKLASTLVGKSFDVSDGFLRRVRVAQFQKGRVRVVLEVDAVSDYSAFLLPNPYRLIIDIHGRKAGAVQTAHAQPGAAQAAPEPAPEAAPPTTPQPVASAAPPQGLTVPESEDAAVKPVPEFGPQLVSGGYDPHGHEVTSGESSFPSAASARNEASNRSVDTNSPLSFDKAPSAPPQPASAVAPTPTASSRTAPAPQPAETQPSTKAEVANLDGQEVKATEKPTSEPTVQVVAPRAPEKTLTATRRTQKAPEGHQAQPTADGQRSLIRALGLKVGKIVIDAGHGGHDTGTIGPNGLLEKDLVLDVSLRLGRLLQSKMGADVIYTRDDDTFIPLETRTAIANQEQADLFVSVHANSSSDPSARGVETYYLNFNPSPDALEVAARENAVSEKSVHELGDLVKKITLKDKVEESREFATDVQHALYQGLAGKDTGRSALRDRGVKKAPFIVLIGANMPSILAEISFVSNPADERKLQTPDYRQKIAESLYRGIARYVNGLSGVKVARAGAGEREQ